MATHIDNMAHTAGLPAVCEGRDAPWCRSNLVAGVFEWKGPVESFESQKYKYLGQAAAGSTNNTPYTVNHSITDTAASGTLATTGPVTTAEEATGVRHFPKTGNALKQATTTVTFEVPTPISAAEKKFMDDCFDFSAFGSSTAASPVENTLEPHQPTDAQMMVAGRDLAVATANHPTLGNHPIPDTAMVHPQTVNNWATPITGNNITATASASSDITTMPFASNTNIMPTSTIPNTNTSAGGGNFSVADLRTAFTAYFPVQPGPREYTVRGCYVLSEFDALRLVCWAFNYLRTIFEKHPPNKASIAQSGHVYVYRHSEALTRWTDGKYWSASRKTPEGLIYRELTGPRLNEKVPPGGGTQITPGNCEQYLNVSATALLAASSQDDLAGATREFTGCLSDTRLFKRNGLFKRTFTFVLGPEKYTVVSYYNLEDIVRRRIKNYGVAYDNGDMFRPDQEDLAGNQAGINLVPALDPTLIPPAD